MALTYWDDLYHHVQHHQFLNHLENGHHHPHVVEHYPTTMEPRKCPLAQRILIIDQRSIMDVARTSNHTGTNSLDVVRSARFSQPLSSTPTQQYHVQFPSDAPEHGWFGRIGLKRSSSSNSSSNSNNCEGTTTSSDSTFSRDNDHIDRNIHDKEKKVEFNTRSLSATTITDDSLYDHTGLLTMYYPERASESSWLHSSNCKNKLGGFESGVKCWVSELVHEFLKQDIPVICLMFYENPQVSGDYEGHYRLAVGYESEMVTTTKFVGQQRNGALSTTTKEVVKRIIMYDPYDRDGNAPISNFTVEEFCHLWNYTELRFNDTCYKPYFGVALMPLRLWMNSKDRVRYTLHTQYPCFRNFPQLLSTRLHDVSAHVTLFGINQNPILFQTKIPITKQMDLCQEHVMELNLMQWISNSTILEQVSHIRVSVSGMICDHTLKWLYEENTNKFSEAYSYCDRVGGSLFISR